MKQSWQLLVPIADDIARRFYRRLLESDPSLVPLFRHVDMAAQRNKLLQILAIVVSRLDHPEKLLPVVRDLGRRHANYGISDRHYDTVGATLLWTLEHSLSEAWTPAVAKAWAAAYTMLADEMRPLSSRAA